LIVEPFLEPDSEDEIDLTSLNPAQVRELYATGAYFRDDDGPQDVMAAMDLSWRSDLVESLDPFGRLSTDRTLLPRLNRGASPTNNSRTNISKNFPLGTPAGRLSEVFPASICPLIS
jgi:hypothetical protein